MKQVLKVSLIVGGILLTLLCAILLYAAGVTAGVRIEPEKLTLSSPCVRLYDRDGEPMEGAYSTVVPRASFPEYLPNAFIAVEDKRFYSHDGLDRRRILAALWNNIRTFSFREGASTISQQLIKNTHLSSEKTLARKLKEMKLTKQLEKQYSKEEILELYLNSIYFGHDAFGIGNAAAFYFGKETEELSPAECAMLAALVRSPNRYSPFRDREACLSRRNFVLKLMKEQGYLTEELLRAALTEELPQKPAKTGKSNAYISAVLEELSSLLPGWSGESVKVYTYCDTALQEETERLPSPSDRSAVVIDNLTHGIKALSSTCGMPNRLPASTLKPLLVYAPAIEEGLICPATPILDAKTDFAGYSPDDAGGASGEYMSVRYALSRSVNIPAVRILNSLGLEKASAYLEKMGLPVAEEDRTLALALGGMKEGFPLPALANGYAMLASGGNYAPAQTILRIEDEKGKVLYKRQPHPTRVFSEGTCYLVSDMLQTAVREGTAKKLRTLPFDVCAKTGTAEGKKGNTDAYTIAYTSCDTVGVWMGNRDNSPIQETGGGLPANAVCRLLEALYKDTPPSPLPPCEEVEWLAYDRQEYETNHTVVLSDPLSPLCEDRKELFKKDALPTKTSTRYSCPTIPMPQIQVKNGSVNIVLFQTKYYEYVIKRENRGITTTIYQGKYQKIICDNSVKAGESYRYTVTPYFKDKAGETVELPLVHIQTPSSPPEDWCQKVTTSCVASASSMRASVSKWASSFWIKES